MTRLAPFALAVLSVVSCLFASCGGGGGSEAGTPPPDAPPPAPPPPAPPPAPPPDAALDAEIARLASRAGVVPAPAAPAQDPDVVELGRALFFDRILSGNRDISCYTCHDVGVATADALSVSIGTGGFGGNAERRLADGTLIPRNAPSLLRLSRRTAMFLDSRVAEAPDGTLSTPEPSLDGPAPTAGPEVAALLDSALAAQAMFPPTSHEEMAGRPGDNEIADAASAEEVWRLLMLRLVGTDDDAEPGVAAYRDLFARAYPGVARWSDFHFAHAAHAIAAFEIAAFETRGARFDRWLEGDRTSLGAVEKRGAVLFFGRAGCARCHGGPDLSDFRHHAIGVPQVGPGKDFPFEDTGRALVTGDPRDVYRFRTPTLRNVALTGPWMHDGAYTSLEAAVAHYRDPIAALLGYDASQLAPLFQPLVDRDPVRQAARAAAVSPLVRDGLRLRDDEVDAIVAFLGALTDEDATDLEDAEPESVPSGLPIDDEEDE
jgi:cytochrome c peroxidase